MDIFQDVRLEWDGKVYTIRSSRVMGAIAAVEKHITGAELHRMALERNTIPLATVSMGYAALLQYAGGEVTDQQIYRRMFNKADAQETAINAVKGLLALMNPPAEMVTAADRKAGETKPAAAKSSRPRTGQRSVPGA